MSSTRQDLIARGIVRPGALVRRGISRKTERELVEAFERTESLAKQLYSVFTGVLIEKDPSVKDEIEAYETLEADMQDCYRAQAKYVLSTFRDNERLRARVKELERGR